MKTAIAISGENEGLNYFKGFLEFNDLDFSF